MYYDVDNEDSDPLDLGLYYECEKVEIELRAEVKNLKHTVEKLRKELEDREKRQEKQKNSNAMSVPRKAFKTTYHTFLLPVDPLKTPIPQRTGLSSEIEEIESFSDSE